MVQTKMDTQHITMEMRQTFIIMMAVHGTLQQVKAEYGGMVVLLLKGIKFLRKNKDV